MLSLDVTIPGPPVGQSRGRAGVVMTKNGPVMVNGRPIVRVHDPAKSRTWKATAQDHIRDAMAGRELLEGPVVAIVESWIPLPATQHRKRAPVAAGWNLGAKDSDNLAKAVLDSANGVAWVDDRCVALLISAKMTAAQGEPPRVRLRAMKLSTFRAMSEAIVEVALRLDNAAVERTIESVGAGR